MSSEQSHLGRALGVNPHVEIDYRAVRIEEGDIFVLTTDGVHDYIGAECIVGEIEAGPDDLDGAARRIVETAYEAGSPDNLTVQIVRVEALPLGEPLDARPFKSFLSSTTLIRALDNPLLGLGP